MKNNIVNVKILHKQDKEKECQGLVKNVAITNPIGNFRDCRKMAANGLPLAVRRDFEKLNLIQDENII